MSSDPELLERLRKARSRAQNLVSTYSTDKPLQRTLSCLCVVDDRPSLMDTLARARRHGRAGGRCVAAVGHVEDYQQGRQHTVWQRRSEQQQHVQHQQTRAPAS